MADIAAAMKELAPIFACGVAVQHLNEILDPITTALANVGKGDSNTKKVVVGVASLVFSLVVVANCGLGILRALSFQASDWLDALLTALIISTGTEGINSIVKFLGYAKEQKKAESGLEKKAAGGGNVQTVNRETAIGLAR